MNKASWFMLILVLAGFVFGLSHLFRLRFEMGDVYPEYSSLRADPLGCKALFESLGQLRPARRHFDPIAKLPVGDSATLFYLGVDPQDLNFSRADFEILENFVRTGGRLVITLRPVYRAGPARFFRGLRAPGRRPPSSRQPEGHLQATEHITERWGLGFQYEPLTRDSEGVYEPEPAFLQDSEAAPPEPSSLDVYTALWFTNLTDSWTVVYARTNDRPVLLERSWGSGSMVVYADSYALSNEALLLDRQPALLAWLADHSAQYIFDETHLGVHSTPGVAMLLHQYHLHGALLLLLLLACLYLWKNVLPFVPALQDSPNSKARAVVTGREASVGFVNLLRRNIPSADLLKTCLEQWQVHFRRTAPKPSRKRLEAMQALIDAENALPPKHQDPVRTYNEFARILNHRNLP